MPAPTATLFYAKDGYDTSRPRLMGRHAAGEGFLRGMVRHSGFDRLVALVPRPADAEAFQAQARDLGATMALEAVPEAELHRVAETGCLMLPGPEMAGLGWRRQRTGAARFSLVGITHTTASHGAMDSIADLLTGPLQPWDALICTSAAVRASVTRLLEAEAAWLAERLGATRFPRPALPVIPLGVDVLALARDGGARAAWRQRLGVGPADVVVLHHGRLSFHAKAHPLPMFLGLGRAAAAAPAGARVHLVLSGWFADEVQRGAFQAMAQALCPMLAIHHVDGRLPEVRRQIWSAADVFTLLSDNIQETFGLAPVEAMAAGLPVVTSDWDGLRDTVAHGVTGFRVKTLMGGPMGDLAARHEATLDSYDSYIGGAAQFTAVDVAATEAAFRALVADAGLRARMGEAGRLRAAALFDWSAVIAQYRALWAELAAIRGAAAPASGESPRRPDPALLFADYPTAQLRPATRLRLAPGIADSTAAVTRLMALSAIPGIAPRRELLPGEDSFRAALRVLESGPASVADIAATLPPGRAARLARALAWLVKIDVLRVAEEVG
ncbi:glycosyltransferase family 4 protein [Falsiroseomonas sp.]|uniref:glycosyltransferase family 4 protein n=1 Tax=Falsiroseomonas sp. TaxID=2870721 RepID=UPI003F70FA3F